MAPDWNTIDAFLDKKFRRTRSVFSKRYYSSGITQFKIYCERKGLDVTRDNVYDVLDGFSGYLDEKGLKAKTVIDYVTAARAFLNFNKIKVDPTDFKTNVTLPFATQIEDKPLTVDNVRRILTAGRPNKKMRALILVLLSSGIRIGEALSLRVEDVDLQSNPAIVRVRAVNSKTRVGREIFISDEARDAMKPLVEGAPPLRLLFEYSGDIYQQEKVADRTFRDIVERAGLGGKIEGHRTHQIHFHVFRKFFLTKGSDVIGDHAAHALCGHGFYMSTYYRKSLEERAADYLRLMPYLTVFKEAPPDRQEVQRTFRREWLKASGYTDEKMKDMDWEKMSDEEFHRTARDMLLSTSKDELLKMLANNGNSQRVISADHVKEGEVKKLIEAGWEFVATLPDGSVVVRLPKAGS